MIMPCGGDERVIFITAKSLKLAMEEGVQWRRIFAKLSFANEKQI